MTLTDIPGIMVGHATDQSNMTGCTAILCPEGAVGAKEFRGMAPGSKETELLDPLGRVEEVQGIVLSGGSAFGLASASGVMRWLVERGYGFQTSYARVPIVPCAILYDLNFNQTLRLPDENMGYEAAQAASSDPVVMGCVGAGTGATAGKMAGFNRAMKSGLGSAGIEIGGIKVAALAAANPLGDIIDPDTGRILAGARSPDGRKIQGSMSIITGGEKLISPFASSNTVLGVVATNAVLTKIQAARVARMASAGFARSLRPAHTLADGDIIFVLATGQGPPGEENMVGTLGAEVLSWAIAAAARTAKGLPEIPAWQDMI